MKKKPSKPELQAERRGMLRAARLWQFVIQRVEAGAAPEYRERALFWNRGVNQYRDLIRERAKATR